MSAEQRPPERTATHERRKLIKGSRRTVLATGVATAALVIGGTVSLAAGFLTHRVQDGDTLSELALHYDTTVGELVSLNGIQNPDLIVVDDDLKIRQLADDATTRTILYGDTLTSIAESLGVTVEELAAANGLDNPDLIVTGEQLVVPSDAVSGIASHDETEVSESEAPASEEAGEAQVEEVADTTDPAEDADSPDESGAVLVTNEVQPQSPANAVQAGEATLHLVAGGETVESIAETYGVSAAQLLAANGHARNGISPGMILKVPPAGAQSVQLVGMPSAVEYSPVGSELTAVSVATAYWGSSIGETSLYESLELSDNPHVGFRGAIDGEWGGTDDYGVYAGPLAEAVAQNGFVGDVFHGDGDASALTNRIDMGLPVVVWMTYESAVVEPVRVEDDVRPFTLVPSKQAVVVYGYDDEGVLVVDTANGGYAHVNWTDFMRSWGYFDGMALAISPI